MEEIAARLRAAGCVFAEDEARLLIDTAPTPARLEEMVGRRVAGLPLEQVLGWAGFCGLRVAVEPGVFVPRRRTEFLARQAITLAQSTTAEPLVVLDMCCGTGAVGAAIAVAVTTADLYAVDKDPAAVRCAKRNLNGQVYEGDLYDPLPTALQGRIAVITANVPYVPSDEVALLPPEARLYEPRLALDGGADGLDIMRRVADEAPRWLAAGGHLLIESSHRQEPTALAVFTDSGLQARAIRDEDLAISVIVGTKP